MKKLLSTAMALVLIIGLLTGCSVESQGEKTESVSNQYYLYYLNKDETKVTKTRYYPEQESAEFMLQDLMGILNGQESSGENLPLLPAGVQLVTYRLNESLLESLMLITVIFPEPGRFWCAQVWQELFFRFQESPA